MSDPKAAILGLGARGQAWAMRLAQAGWTLRLFDPIPDLAQGVAETIAPEATGAAPEVTGTISAAVDGAVWITECVPDRALLKHKLYEVVQRHADGQAVLASSARTFDTETLRAGALRPETILIARLDRAWGHVSLIAAPSVGTGLLAHAERVLSTSGILCLQVPEGPARAAPVRPRPRVVRLGGSPGPTRPVTPTSQDRPADPVQKR